MGLAFEVYDSKQVGGGKVIGDKVGGGNVVGDKVGGGNSLEHKYRKINPSFLDMFHYTFTHAGILTGQLRVQGGDSSKLKNLLSYFFTCNFQMKFSARKANCC